MGKYECPVIDRAHEMNGDRNASDTWNYDCLVWKYSVCKIATKRAQNIAYRDTMTLGESSEEVGPIQHAYINIIH